MRRLAMLVLGLVACGRTAATGPVSARAPLPGGATGPGTPATSGTGTRPALPVAAQVVTVGAAPPASRRVAMFHVDDQVAVTIDDAGQARHTGNPLFLGQTERWIPFSEPVDGVVYVKQLAFPDRPNARLGRLFCGHTRAAAVECVLDFEASATAPRETRRFRLPFDGAVQRLGVYTPSPVFTRGGPDKAVCATTARGSACWAFAWDGLSATPYALDAALAEEAAAGVTQHTLAAWQRAAPSMAASRVRKVVRSESSDTANVVPGPPGASGAPQNIAVQCALIDGGQLSCYGPGAYGELGDGTHALDWRASRPFGEAVVVDVAMGRHHGCAVLADGRAACWGELPADLPLPKRHKTTPLPMCTFDRAASEAAFAAARAADVQGAQQCAATCRNGPGQRDACLGCVTHCVPLRYIFKRDRVCQEPYLESTLVQQGIRCAEAGQVPHWLTDQELRNQVSAVNLTLAPVILTAITDAVAVALPPGRPSVCVLRRSGEIACINDEGKLSNKP